MSKDERYVVRDRNGVPWFECARTGHDSYPHLKRLKDLKARGLKCILTRAEAEKVRDLAKKSFPECAPFVIKRLISRKAAKPKAPREVFALFSGEGSFGGAFVSRAAAVEHGTPWANVVRYVLAEEEGRR